LVNVEASGLGLDSGKTAATTDKGSSGILHGFKTLLMQDGDGQVTEPYSISAGLDYPGIGPLHAYLHASKRAVFKYVTDKEAMDAGVNLSKKEGIIPAIETAHAFAALDQMELEEDDVVVINLSGRGDKDLQTYIDFGNY
jgi:tryptophan synthase beta chain